MIIKVKNFKTKSENERTNNKKSVKRTKNENVNVNDDPTEEQLTSLRCCWSGQERPTARQNSSDGNPTNENSSDENLTKENSSDENQTNENSSNENQT